MKSSLPWIAKDGRSGSLEVPLGLGFFASDPVARLSGLYVQAPMPKNLLPGSVVSRPLEGEAPTIDLVVGYHKVEHLHDSENVPLQN